jgi:hypothetical protein
MILFKKNVFILFILFSLGESYCQNAKPLFQSDNILKLTITLPLEKVINDLEVRDEHPAILSYQVTDGENEIHQIKIQVRGKTRALKTTCKFPPLQLNFKKSKTKNTLFEGQNKLKLVTHCKNTNLYSNYIQKEYTTYKLYQKITPYSFNVRLCEISYIDQNNSNKSSTHYGFIIEHIKDVAKRNDLKVFDESIRNQEVLGKENLDKLSFFEYLIGNLDWSITNRHNIKIMINKKGGLPIGVPYDFDYSGIVGTGYAVPPPGFDISSVKTRVFRGMCRNNGYKPTIEFYQQHKPVLLTVLKNATYLSDNGRNSMEKYLLSFYDILDNIGNTEKKIVKACWANHKHLYEYVK